MLTPDIILIIAGCILLLIGLVGGGITSKYATVGKVDGREARIFCVVIGFVLIAIGVAVKFWPQVVSNRSTQAKQPPTSASVAPPQDSEKSSPVSPPISFSITEDLRSQIGSGFTDSEEVTVAINGEEKGKISVSYNHVLKTMVLSVPTGGYYNLEFNVLRELSVTHDIELWGDSQRIYIADKDLFKLVVQKDRVYLVRE